MAGEQVIINEDTSFIRSIETVKTFGIQDIKSVYQDTSSHYLDTLVILLQTQFFKES